MKNFETPLPEFNLDEIMAVTARLSELVKDDLMSLKQMRIGKIKDTHKEKLELAGILEGYKNALKANPELLKKFSKEALEEAKSKSKSFDATLQEGHKELKKAHTAHGAVLDLIRSVVSEKTTPVRCYQKNGAYGSASKEQVFTRPLNLDERI